MNYFKFDGILFKICDDSRTILRIIIRMILSVNVCTRMALLDLEKAYDTKWRDGPTFKLYKFQFPI